MNYLKIRCHCGSWFLLFILASNAPINSKLQPPPPRAYTGHLTVHRAQGGENLNVALKGWGIWTKFISRSGIFWFLQGLTDLQDRILKRVFKRSLKVSLQHISLWKTCRVCEWRRDLSLRRGSSVLVGGAFERLLAPRGGNLNKPIFNS